MSKEFRSHRIPILTRRLRDVGTVLALLGGLAAPAMSQTDLALNKPATASSIQKEGNPNDYRASYAVDGNNRTRWGSDYKDSQWIYIDLQAFYTVNRVVIHWEDANPNTYRMEMSDDLSSWNLLARLSNMPIGERVDTVKGSKAGRYIRMFCEKRNQSKLYLPIIEYNGMSIWTMKVYGEPATPSGLGNAGIAGSPVISPRPRWETRLVNPAASDILTWGYDLTGRHEAAWSIKALQVRVGPSK
jgi:hypothetical protein